MTSKNRRLHILQDPQLFVPNNKRLGGYTQWVHFFFKKAHITQKTSSRQTTSRPQESKFFLIKNPGICSGALQRRFRAISREDPQASCCLAQGAWGSFLVTFLILRRKAPWLLCWKGLWFSCVRVLFVLWPWSRLSWRSILSDVRFFGEKSALTECSPRASCYLEQKVGGSWIWVVW